jgi:transposase-like protein
MTKKYFHEGLFCPHCESIKIVRYGKYGNGKQRYLCRNCNTTFSDYTNTLLCGSQNHEKWKPFVECILKGYSLRKSAEIVGVSYITLFYWRHKILKTLTEIENNNV